MLFNTSRLILLALAVSSFAGCSGCSKQAVQPEGAEPQRPVANIEMKPEQHDDQGVGAQNPHAEQPSDSTQLSAIPRANGSIRSDAGESEEKATEPSPTAMTKNPADVRAARTAGERALASAHAAAKSKEFGKAYQSALEGWEQVNDCANQDAACRELAKSLLAFLDQYGDLANQSAGVVNASPPSNKKLLLK